MLASQAQVLARGVPTVASCFRATLHHVKSVFKAGVVQL